MTQTRFIIASALALLIALPVYCSDDKGKEDLRYHAYSALMNIESIDRIVVPPMVSVPNPRGPEAPGMVPVLDPPIYDLAARHTKAIGIIKANPFEEGKDIFEYIDTLNKAIRLNNEARDQVRLHFKGSDYIARSLDHAHKTVLEIYYSLDGVDGVHRIIFHRISHEQDPRIIKLDVANVMTIDDNRRLREVESVIRWARIPESLKEWAKKWPLITTGEYVSIVHKPLEQDNLVLYPLEDEDTQKYPRPEGNALNQFYEYWGQDSIRSKYIYMNIGGECFMTRTVYMYLFPLNQPDITQLKGSLKNTMAKYFGEAVVPITRKTESFVTFKKLAISGLLRNFATTEVEKHPIPGKKNKFRTSKKLVLKPCTIENKGFQLIPQGNLVHGFYKFLEELPPAPERGVRQVWLREPAYTTGRLEIQLDGVKVDGQWAAPLSKAAPALVPFINKGNLVLDLSTILGSMVPEDYLELRTYLTSAYLMGIDYTSLEYYPKEMSLSDKGFFRKDAAHARLVEVVEADLHHINTMERYWKNLHKLIESLKDLTWLEFDFAAGLLFKESQGADGLTENQLSQLLSKLVPIKQIVMPKVKLAPRLYTPFFQTIEDNKWSLQHLDLTGASDLNNSFNYIKNAVRKLEYIESLSVIKSDLSAFHLIELTKELTEKKYLTDLKISMPYSTWAGTPRTIMYPVEFLTEAWADTVKLEKALFVIGAPITVPVFIAVSALSSLCGLKKDVAFCLFDQPVFTFYFGDSFAQTYQNLIRVPNLERLTLDVGGFNHDYYNWVRRQFISDHKTVHQKPEGAEPVQIEFMI